MAEPMNTEPVNSESMPGEPVNTESMPGEPVNTESMPGEPVNTEPMPGESVNTEPMPEEPANTEPMPEEPSTDSNETKKKSNKRKILIPIIAAAVVLVLIFAIILPAMHSSAYKRALALMEEENYADAKAGFEKLGDYMDSSWQAEVCENYIEAEDIYASAMKQYNSGNWKRSEKKLNEILKLEETYFHKDYKDTKTLVKSCQNHQKYDEAAELIKHEDEISDVEKALKIFQELGDFEESKANAEKCQEMINNNEAYQQALEVLGKKDYAKAEGLFNKLGDYKDSAKKAKECRIMIDYKAAAELYNAGEYTKAIEAFEALENTYSNAGAVIGNYGKEKLDTMKERAKAQEAFNEAEKKFKEGDYAGAAKILDGINTNFLLADSLDRRQEMLTTIRQKGDYDQAMNNYNNGRYYEAYKAFLKCEGYKDAADMAKKCAQPFPAPGVVYMNDAYGDRSSELTINNAGYMNAYYKLYFGEDLVMTVFIPEDGIATFALPAGNYRMTKGYGKTWYGTTDLFGDDGYYWVCSFGTSETAPIEPGYAYEIKSGGEGTGIGTSSSDRDSI